MVKKIIKIILISLISLIALWFCCAWLLSKIKTNSNAIKSQKNITIYVKSNGMHTDIVMPINTDVYDWDSFLDKTWFLDINETYQYVSIGWGDKGFYLNTPTMADLKAKTLTNALFGLGSTAMHVTYYKNIKHYPIDFAFLSIHHSCYKYSTKVFVKCFFRLFAYPFAYTLNLF